MWCARIDAEWNDIPREFNNFPNRDWLLKRQRNRLKILTLYIKAE